MSELNKTGNWIYITKDLNLEIPIDKLSIFYAKPVGYYIRGARHIGENRYRRRASELGLDPREYHSLIHKYLDKGSDSIGVKDVRQKIGRDIDVYNYTLDDFVSVAEVVTPFGTARVYPEEYNVVSLDFALDSVNMGSHMIRYLSNDGDVQGKMKNNKISEKVFYLRSRGIRFTDAMKEVSGEIRTQYLMYFDPLPQYIHQFSRVFVDRALKKRKYCKENGFEQLLYYEGKEEGEKTKFQLDDYLHHLEEEWDEKILEEPQTKQV